VSKETIKSGAAKLCKALQRPMMQHCDSRQESHRTILGQFQRLDLYHLPIALLIVSALVGENPEQA
jgi:hypothetical protein